MYGTKKNRTEELQDVPLAISAFNERAIDARQFITIEDLSFASPNVTLDQIGTTPGVQNFSIRGLGINSLIPSVDPTVGLFMDGVYLGITTGVVVDTFDLESIEILRGPQGLLFGRNVTGGAVLLRSKRPTGEFGAKAKINYETGPQYSASAVVEGSLTFYGKNLSDEAIIQASTPLPFAAFGAPRFTPYRKAAAGAWS